MISYAVGNGQTVKYNIFRIVSAFKDYIFKWILRVFVSEVPPITANGALEKTVLSWFPLFITTFY